MGSALILRAAYGWPAVRLVLGMPDLASSNKLAYRESYTCHLSCHGRDCHVCYAVFTGAGVCGMATCRACCARNEMGELRLWFAMDLQLCIAIDVNSLHLRCVSWCGAFGCGSELDRLRIWTDGRLASVNKGALSHQVCCLHRPTELCRASSTDCALCAFVLMLDHQW